MSATETIASSGFPLGFKFRQGAGRNSQRPAAVTGAGRDVFVTEARHFSAHHQKEAVVTEGCHGSAWRMVSDEGLHIKGDNLAPFPLGFYNAGLQADLANRIRALAHARALHIGTLQLQCITGYSMTGSFFRGDGEGAAEPARIQVSAHGSVTPAAFRRLVADAVAASPALASMSRPLINTFALYVNGSRRSVTSLLASPATDATDPLKIHAHAPAPLSGGATDLIAKTGVTREGSIQIAVPAAQPGAAKPVDTHLFLHGSASDEAFETLMRIAARTCFLHATLAATLPPCLSLKLNGCPMPEADKS
jgi:hypothetical protein